MQTSAWVVASALLIALGWLPLTQLGVALVVVQAVAVAALAELQIVAFLRARGSNAVYART